MKFTDYMLGENASRWRDMEVFLSTRDIRGVWVDFLNQNPPIKSKQGFHNDRHLQAGNIKQPINNPTFPQGQTSGNHRPKQNQPATTPSSALKVAPFLFLEDVCIMYNLGRYIKAPGTCTDKRGRQLRHVCNYRPDPSKPQDSCGKNHAACLFH